ncbi:hypothetical protein H072_5206 [Dactylellina haptotyla CBS 200.50]|uniref:Mid2 domain-containing protein n=1 Tax=Dactylellina haptotyla (strain CBS 200.50) TaxID=1284197 RepID=S8BN92_DACHA|nr:hypothetical protein H072_5206 [Dactylellina haptotyla CBS 200.50]
MGLIITAALAGATAAAVATAPIENRPTDIPESEKIHPGTFDALNTRPKITNCIIITVCALVVGGFAVICLWKCIKQRCRRRPRRTQDEAEVEPFSRHRRRHSRRRRFGEPPPPYSYSYMPPVVNRRGLGRERVPTIDGVELRQYARDSRLPKVPAPVYRNQDYHQ